MIVAISGTPATGKTAVARELGKILSWKVISLNDYAREKRMIVGRDEQRDSDVVDVDAVKESLKEIKGNIIIESHYAHEMDSDLLVILRANPAQIRKRSKEKKWSREKTEENIEAEIMEICLDEARSAGKKPVVIDTTKKTAKEVAEEIAGIVRKKEIA